MATNRPDVLITASLDGPQVQYAVRQLAERLRKAGYADVVTAGIDGSARATGTDRHTGCHIELVVDTDHLGPESFEIAPFRVDAGTDAGTREDAAVEPGPRTGIRIAAGDGRGLIYGALHVSDLVARGIGLDEIPVCREVPRLGFRAIKFDLPWDTYRHSYALSQHQETCRDLGYWEAFLDMMCANRLNVLTLWNLHPYPFLIKPTNFPEASPWTDTEMAEWKSLFAAVFRLAHERGIDTYVMPFNIFVTPEFARAHGVATDNLEHHFFVDGDRSEVIKRYTRECVTQMLEEYPLLTGIGLTLGEGMGGMTPAEREEWIRETIVEGMRRADRQSKLIHRIPFSGGTGSAGATTVEMERVTRAGIEKEARLGCFEKPIHAGLKFNWSHPLSTTRLVKVHGGKLYGTYFDPVPTDYKVFWTARNEDIFCLRWGVPSFIRQHIAENSHDYVGGYMIGSETYIPAKDYFTRPGFKVPWRYAFERQWLYYLLWGRLLYDHTVDDAVIAAGFTRRYGEAGRALMEAHELAGRTPLRLGFSFDTTWDFTLYAEGFMARNPDAPDGPRVEFISVDRLISQPPLDPSYVAIPEYVDAVARDESFGDDRLTPVAMAAELEADCRRALEIIESIDPGDDIALSFELADVATWARMGLYFACKLRGAVALQRYRTQGSDVTPGTGDAARATAVAELEEALVHWDAVIDLTRPLYNEMPLTHLSEQDGRPWQENDHLRFHWALLRPDVERDIEIARTEGGP